MSHAADVPTANPVTPVDEHVVYAAGKGFHEEGRWIRVRRYCARNPSLPVGLGLLLSLVAFTVLGRLVWSPDLAAPLSGFPSRPPNADNPLGTDTQGRDILAVTIVGTWLTMRTGIVAALLGTAVGGSLGSCRAITAAGWTTSSTGRSTCC